jgi:hypothetical protein
MNASCSIILPRLGAPGNRSTECQSIPEVALSELRQMSDLSPQSEPKRTLIRSSHCLLAAKRLQAASGPIAFGFGKKSQMGGPRSRSAVPETLPDCRWSLTVRWTSNAYPKPRAFKARAATAPWAQLSLLDSALVVQIRLRERPRDLRPGHPARLRPQAGHRRGGVLGRGHERLSAKRCSGPKHT